MQDFGKRCSEMLKDVIERVEDIKTRCVDKRLDDKTLLDIFEKVKCFYLSLFKQLSEIYIVSF